jgi:hypothetical protein
MECSRSFNYTTGTIRCWVPFRICSNNKVIHTGRILGMSIGEEPFYDLNFVGEVDTIEYKNQSGYWEAIN